jgi:hypothetical protein
VKIEPEGRAAREITRPAVGAGKCRKQYARRIRELFEQA